MAFRVNEVQRSLKGADLPMSGKVLAELATRHGAGDDLVQVLCGVGEANRPNEGMRQLEDHLGGEPGDD